MAYFLENKSQLTPISLPSNITYEALFVSCKYNLWGTVCEL